MEDVDTARRQLVVVGLEIPPFVATEFIGLGRTFGFLVVYDGLDQFTVGREDSDRTLRRQVDEFELALKARDFPFAGDHVGIRHHLDVELVEFDQFKLALVDEDVIVLHWRNPHAVRGRNRPPVERGRNRVAGPERTTILLQRNPQTGNV